MNKRIAFIAAGVAILVAIPAVIALSKNHNVSELQPSEVFTWDCEIPDQRPEAITITCGDGGQYIDGITWENWSASGAKGFGIYHVNECDPNCADGNFLSAKVKVKLSNLATFKGKSYLRTLNFRTLDGANLPNSGQSFYEWDVMEFAEMMTQ